MKEGRDRKRRLSNEGKRSVHVKWDGKTIALGTFPDKEASIMCKRARVLTKTWRSADPKPNVEDVKQSLERLGIRVVNDRPGRQSKKKDSTMPNKKRRIISEEEVLPAVYGIQQSCYSPVSAIIATPPHAIATATTNQHPRADLIANIAKSGTSSPPSYNNFRTDSFMITPREPINGLVTPLFTSSHRIEPIGSHQGSNDPVAEPRIKFVADSKLQNTEQVAQPDMELHSDMTYQMLEKHYLNVQNEMEEIKKLMIIYKQRLPKRKNGKLINQQVGIQPDPTIINQVPNSPIHSNQDYNNDETELSEAEEMTELQTLLSDSEDNDSVTQMIFLEDW